MNQSTFIASRGCRNITPSDTGELADVALQLYVTQAGTLHVTGIDGIETTITITSAMVAGGGYTHPSAVTKVWANGTTASGIIAYV